MNLVYHCTDNYAQITATSIISVFENNKDIDEINVYIVENGFTQETKNRMIELADCYGRKMFFIPVPDFNREYDLGLVSIKKKWMFDSYSRLFLDKLIPDCDRVLYLDGDIVVTGSLKKLWKMELEGKCCAAALDCISEPYYQLFGLKEGSRYYNSGVILIDLNTWRKKHISSKVKDYVKQNKGYVFFMEQTVFNAVLQNQIKCLGAKFNVSTLMQTMTLNELKQLRRYKDFYGQEEVDKALKNPVILHMTDFFYVVNRAWNEITNHPAREQFIKYCSKLEWNQYILQKDNRNISTKVKDFFIHVIPKPFLIWIVSWVYNGWRVNNIQRQSKNVRGKKL